MIVDSLKGMCFNCNETDICVIDSIFSVNDQQKVYSQLYRFIVHMPRCLERGRNRGIVNKYVCNT